MQNASLTAALARLATVGAPVAAALALAACASKPIDQPAPAPVVTAKQTAVTTAQTTPPPMTAPSVATPLAAYLDPNSPISQQRSVYFAYDNDTLRSQDKSVVELQGRYLSQHPDVHVTVAGNTDERGGSEYNLALGQKRAEAVVKALELLGVGESQLEATSYGKERPADPGHDEAAWAKNRRVELRTK